MHEVGSGYSHLAILGKNFPESLSWLVRMQEAIDNCCAPTCQTTLCEGQGFRDICADTGILRSH